VLRVVVPPTPAHPDAAFRASGTQRESREKKEKIYIYIQICIYI
jgi:hypothetical protein